MNDMSICALCNSQAPLLNSHVIPKFCVEWMKKSGPTKYIRQAKVPNRRLQDIQKIRLLCASCEGRLSKWEKCFAEQVFVPYMETRQQAFDYRHWMLRFAVSLAWRTAVRTIDIMREKNVALADATDQAMECWADFMLDKREDAGPYAHHLFFLDVLSPSTTAEVLDKMHWYSLGGIDSTMAYSDTHINAYTKLPAMIFWSGILPAQPVGWHGTLIKHKGRIKTPQTINAPGFGEFFQDRVRYTRDQFAQMSPKQADLIHDEATQDLEKLASSPAFETIMAERYWKHRRETEAGDEQPD